MTRQEELEDILETTNSPNEAIDAVLESPQGGKSIIPELIRIAWKTKRENAALELQLMETANSVATSGQTVELKPVEDAVYSGAEIAGRAIGNLVEAIVEKVISAEEPEKNYERINQIVTLVNALNKA